MDWNLNSEKPIYLQLIEQIEIYIVSGHFKPGEKLQSVRELAAIVAVNPNTMQKALSKLEEKGLVCTKSTVGKTITDDTVKIEELRTELAENLISNLLMKMETLGYSPQEAKELFKKQMGGTNNVSNTGMQKS